LQVLYYRGRAAGGFEDIDADHMASARKRRPQGARQDLPPV
jgi:hypothetical protein